MRSKSWLRWLPPAVILAAGILLSLLARSGALPNPLYRATSWIDLSALFFFAALLIALVWLIVLLLTAAQHNRIICARAVERAAQAEERQRFLRRLDHELKNPLTTIRLGITNLKEDASCPGDEMTGSLDRISHQVQRLQTLVENLRRLGEMDENSLDRTPVNLAEVLEEAQELALSAPENQERKLATAIQQVPWPLPRIQADRDLLVLAFRNLVENALKFSAPDGQVEVRATEDGHAILVEINDTGRGIPPEDLPHIFDELYRAENARGLPGSGLGLTLVRRIIELHGGSVEVASRPQQGTMVRVRLPSSPA